MQVRLKDSPTSVSKYPGLSVEIHERVKQLDNLNNNVDSAPDDREASGILRRGNLMRVVLTRGNLQCQSGAFERYSI